MEILVGMRKRYSSIMAMPVTPPLSSLWGMNKALTAIACIKLPIIIKKSEELGFYFPLHNILLSEASLILEFKYIIRSSYIVCLLKI